MTSRKADHKQEQAIRGVQTQHTHKHSANNIITTTRDAEKKEDERENRTGHECLTFQ